MNVSMTGWKTWLGAGLIGFSVILDSMGYIDLAVKLRELGQMMVAIGIGHKIEKASHLIRK